MLYLLAAIGVVAVGLFVWRAVVPGRVRVGAQRRVVAPDDDPDFLRRLGEQNRRRRDDEPPGA